MREQGQSDPGVTSVDVAIRDPRTWSHPVSRVSEELGISERGTFRLIERGVLKSFKVGGVRRVLHADLLDYIARQREGA